MSFSFCLPSICSYPNTRVPTGQGGHSGSATPEPWSLFPLLTNQIPFFHRLQVPVHGTSRDRDLVRFEFSLNVGRLVDPAIDQIENDRLRVIENFSFEDLFDVFSPFEYGDVPRFELFPRVRR